MASIKIKYITDRVSSQVGGTEVFYGIAFEHIEKSGTHSLVADVDKALVQSLIDAKLVIPVTVAKAE